MKPEKMKPEKLKEVKPVVTTVKQSKQSFAKYLGLKQITGIRAGWNDWD